MVRLTVPRLPRGTLPLHHPGEGVDIRNGVAVDVFVEAVQARLVGEQLTVRATGQVSTRFGETNILAENASLIADPLAVSTDYAGTFDLYFTVGPAALASDKDIILIEADADDLLDDVPGVAVGANEEIQFTLFDPNEEKVSLLRLDEATGETTPVGADFVDNPSGNFDPLGSDADREAYLVPEGNKLAGLWLWSWENLLPHNNVHVWVPQGSPVTYEMAGTPNARVNTSSARPASEWALAPRLRFPPVLAVGARLGRQRVRAGRGCNRLDACAGTLAACRRVRGASFGARQGATRGQAQPGPGRISGRATRQRSNLRWDGSARVGGLRIERRRSGSLRSFLRVKRG